MPDVRTLMRSRPYGFALALAAVLLVANVVTAPAFGAPSNWAAELAVLAPLALVAMASTPSILSGGGGIDISVGPLAVLVNVLLVNTLFAQGVTSAWACIPIVLCLGALVGGFNGVLVTYLRYQPVIATLCTFFVLAGITLKLGATPRTAPAGNWTEQLGESFGPVPGALLLMAVPVVIWLGLSRTAYHRSLYAVGGNDATAYSAGVDVATTRILAYVLGGVFAAVAGIALTAVVQSSQANASALYILIALAGVALGGTQLSGGRGGLLGSALGALCIYLIQTLLAALSVPPTWLQMVYGALLLTGVVVGAALIAPRSRRAAA